MSISFTYTAKVAALGSDLEREVTDVEIRRLKVVADDRHLLGMFVAFIAVDVYSSSDTGEIVDAEYIAGYAQFGAAHALFLSEMIQAPNEWPVDRTPIGFYAGALSTWLETAGGTVDDMTIKQFVETQAEEA